jgi:hypothetical protein
MHIWEGKTKKDLRKYGVTMWIGFILLKTRTNGEMLQGLSDEPSGSTETENLHKQATIM